MPDIVSAPPPERDPQPVILHRLTVVESVYHQINGGGPTHIQSRYSKNLLEGEEVFSTRGRTTSEPKQIPLGWLEGKPLSTVIVENEADGRVPDPQKTLRIAVGGPNAFCIVVLPGESARFSPISSSLWVQSEVPTKYTFHLVPG